jgi:type III secretion system YscI/HrpB-like protein
MTMTAVTAVVLDNVAQVTQGAGAPSVRPVSPADPAAGTAERFAAAMERASGASASQAANAPVKVAQAQNPTVVDAAPAATTNVDAQERARRALGLDAPAQVTRPAPAGDTILDGLQKLRGVFDAQQARINQALSQPMTSVNTLLAVQMEVVNFSMLVDVTSKLTGKSTQAFDTLLKGQ